ncbi:MAG: hypothetical protein K2R98_21730 [Gemmataceae bacterium]|nr:hypothetical protein [Gemmataceae bacterium]
MNKASWIGACLALMIAASSAPANGHIRHTNLDQVNACLHGYVVDYTHNHGADRRIWSPSLCEKRDMYVYLPPGFDPARKYPIVLFLHSFRQDEQAFLEKIVQRFDDAIFCGDLPPFIVAVPDGSIEGKPTYFTAGSFFINTKAGAFEDYVMKDVWPFVLNNYPIRPEREAHVLMGASMGGFGAYNLGIKYRECFKIVIGIFPPVNLRWVDCHGKYRTHFDPCCWGWRTEFHSCEVVARFYCVIAVRMKQLIYPLYGKGGDEALAEISKENPIEMLQTHDVKPGQLDMYIGYGGKDQFFIDAQVDSFLFTARERGLCVDTDFLPDGKHDVATGLRLFPKAAQWLAPRLAPYSPGVKCQESGVRE